MTPDNAEATSIKNLRRRIHRFLHSPAHERTRVTTLIHSLERIGSVAIFGGMIRDLGLGGSKLFWSDVDLVVSARSLSDFEMQLERFAPTQNSFGGYRVRLQRWTADVWRLEDTWAFRNYRLPYSGLGDLPRTAFFNWDAIAYDAGSGVVFCQPDYLETIRERLLDINFEPNPKPLKMVVRALRFVFGRKARLAPRLARYVWRHLSNVSADEIAAVDSARHQRRMLEAAAVRRVTGLLRAHMEVNPHDAFELETEQIDFPLWDSA